MRGPYPRYLTRLLLALAAAGLLVAAAAVAGDPMGLRLLPKHKGTRLTSKPRLCFVTGELRTGRHGTWQLADGTQLQVRDDMEWLEETSGNPAYPASGRLALITGQRLGNVIVVRQATLLSKQRQIEAMGTRLVAPPDQPEPMRPH